MQKIKLLIGRLAVGCVFALCLNLNSLAQTVASASADDLAVMLQAIEQTPPLPASAAPPVGNFYSVQHPEWPPLPGNLFGLPVWNLGDGTWLLDDGSFDYSAQSSSLQMASPAFSPSYIPDAFAFGIGSQGTNVVLHWTSQTNRLYLIDHRATLTGETHWGILADYLLSATDTNITTFVHTNIVQTQPTDFYWLFDVTPVAHDDFFAVNQDSSANQLDIFQNDTDPNDDPINIANLTSPQHGSITNSPDASTFQYTPNPGFYGVDTFTYSITSGYGEVSSNATITVFVNQSGNTPPSANDLIITLQTNVYSVTFNAVTNASGNSPVLYAVNPPNMGSVSNDASSNIIYTRNPNMFGGDAFTYILTDTNGGYAVGNVRVEQQDTSGDGLSDQWDLSYGFDPTADNSLADPAGDGLPNLAKFVLGLNPNVANNPLNLSGVTNGTTISGFAQLPIYGLSMNIPKPPIALWVNDLPASDAVLAQGPDGQWQMDWDTSFLTNGDYQIQLDCPVAPSSSPDSITNVMGAPILVQVNNPITMDKLTSQFTSYLYIYGTLADTNDTFDVYLYDDYGNPLVYATGLSAPNGQIVIGWDLTDGNGTQISFGNIQAVFDLHSSDESGGVQPDDTSPSPVFSTWFLKDIANAGGAFAVAWGWNSYGSQFNNNESQMISDGVVNILGNPSDPNSYNLLPVANIPYGDSTFRYDSDSDKNILLHALNDSGNFFWLGHSSGAGVILGNEKHSGLGTYDVSKQLGNYAYLSTPKHPRANQHPYHLVILDGCETYDQTWANAFGIDFSPGGSVNTRSDYDAVGRPEQALVGWTKIIYLPNVGDYSGLEHAQYANALGTMSGLWMDGYPLYYCVGQFAGSVISQFADDGYYNTGADSWQISGCVDLERQ
ncbi:MAG: Ig-like domain-containing protein [Limisphaerales bacterium]